MDSGLGNSSASFWGEDASDQAGYRVAGAGDVNGDGYDDFLVSAPWDEEGGYNAGQVYLILGKGSGWSMDTDLSSADASFWGEKRLDYAGHSVSGAGDVNGDGYNDILIGAYGSDDGGSQAGQTYLILGKASGWAMDTNLSDSDASFWGEDAGDYSGWSVAGAGDVNGDGYDDILIGAWYDSDAAIDAGQTYLVLGRSTGWAMDTDLSKADASFLGEDVGDHSGYAVAGAGDVNGDGLDDLLIGAEGDDDGGYDAGQTYLVLGKASGWSMDTDLSVADASFRGEGKGDRAGRAVSGAGDANGDGLDDMLIGAMGYGVGDSGAGCTYLVLGMASGWAMDVNLSKANASFDGESDNDRSGTSIAGAGDVDGDGYDDILIGAPYNDGSGFDAGQSYLVLGRASGWTSHMNLSGANASFLGESQQAQAGIVSGAGDVNGDGRDDLLVGAYWDGDGGSQAGQAYLILFEQPDRDDDGVPDTLDAFPDNPYEYVDTDGDGMGDNLDPDADNDGTPDERDAFPLDKSETMDTDGDGTGDNADTDDDGDGVPDASDVFPKNPNEFRDSDRDGIGDRLDPDDDNDGTDDFVEWQDSVNQRFSNIDSALSLLQANIRGDIASSRTSLEDTLSSLQGILADQNEGLMDAIAGVNASLAADIQSSLDLLIASLSAVNSSLAADLLATRDDILSDANALEEWLDAVLAALEAELAATNGTLHGRLSDMDADMAAYYESLARDLDGAMRQLAILEANLSGENEGISEGIAALDLLVHDLSAETLDQLSAKLLELAADIAELDEETAEGLVALAEDIGEFSDRAISELDSVNETLERLGRLNDIMDDLDRLDSDLQNAQDELDESVRTSHDEQMARFNIDMGLVMLVLVLLVLVVVLLLRGRGGRRDEGPGVDTENASESRNNA